MKAERHSLIIIVLFYLFANSLMILNNGMFWDDWCLSSAEGIRNMYNQNGSSYIIQITTFLMSFSESPALLFHVLIAFFETLTIVFFFRVLLQFNFNISIASIITLLFALVPYNLVKVTIICFWYTVGLSFFMMAVYFFTLFIRRKLIIFRVISLAAFVFSFLLLPSTLVLELSFLFVAVIYYLYSEIEFKRNFYRKLLKKLYTWLDFLILPFAFWVFRHFFLLPTGIYAADNYREFSINSVLLTPFNLILAFIQNFIGLGTMANPSSFSILYSVLFLICSLLLLLIWRNKFETPSKNVNFYLFVGLFFFLSGAFPYVMVSLFPTFDGNNSRHQILLKIGTSFLLFYFLSLVSIPGIRKIILATLISVFIVYTVNNQLQYQKSWFKQKALEKEFLQNRTNLDGFNIAVHDDTKEYNEFNKGYAFYCYTGILSRTFGNQSGFAINIEDLPFFLNSNYQSFISDASYNMKDSKNIGTFDKLLVIKKGATYLSNMQSIKMFVQYYLDCKKFDESLGQILILQITDYSTDQTRTIQ